MADTRFTKNDIKMMSFCSHEIHQFAALIFILSNTVSNAFIDFSNHLIQYRTNESCT